MLSENRPYRTVDRKLAVPSWTRPSTYSGKGSLSMVLSGIINCLGYWKRSVEEPDRVLFFRYGEMMANPTKHVRMLANFLGAPFSSEEESAGWWRRW